MKDKEIIEKIEQAPKEMQTMVAKAFLREDIPNEDIQYLFNEEKWEDFNDPSVKIENINAKQPEGIGAGSYTMRTSMPYDNKQYITRGSGGYSNCIKGNPMQSHANVLANCVGYASGRFNELIELARDYHECRYTNLNCNASGFIERAQEAGLEIGDIPRKGAIMCWGGGNGGCGHVAVVERVDFNSQVYTSESDYGGNAFYNATRISDNGRWGLSSSFWFRGFIYQPQDVQEWINADDPKITPCVERDIYKNQLEVKVPNLNVRTYSRLVNVSLGYAPMGIYNYYDKHNDDGYDWYMIAPEQWVAYSPEWENIYPAQQPTEPPTQAPTTPPTQPPEEYVKLKVLDRKDDNVLVELKTWVKE